jgi:hypothetical protein
MECGDLGHFILCSQCCVEAVALSHGRVWVGLKLVVCLFGKHLRVCVTQSASTQCVESWKQFCYRDRKICLWLFVSTVCTIQGDSGF